MVKQTKFRFAFFLLTAIAIISCSKVIHEPAYFHKFESGEVIEISKASGFVNSFMIKLQKPNDTYFEAILDDTSHMNKIEVGDKITLYGLDKDGIIYINHIVSTQNNSFMLKGNVVSTENNRGGYSAIVKDAKGLEYDLLFSISNMGEQFKTYQTGDSINITGDLWTMESKARVTVRTVNEE